MSYIPTKIIDEVLFLNRHICCICHKTKKQIQIHHIDGDPSNSNISNLAILCIEHHSRVTGNEGFGKNFTKGEILKYKNKWEEICIAQNINNEKNTLTLIDKAEKKIRLSSEENFLIFQGKFIKEDTIEYKIESEIDIDFMIMRSKDYEHWLDTGEIYSYEEEEEDIFFDDEFTVPKNGTYFFIVVNNNQDDTFIKFKIKVWR